MDNESAINDQRLLDAIRHGNKEALAGLFDRYYHRLCDFALLYVKSADLAQEVVSNVFFNLWMKRNDLSVCKNPKSYLFICTRNQCINFLKKERLSLTEPLSDQENIRWENQTESAIYYKELLGMVNHLINKMPDQMQIVFKLHKFENLKYKEIALILSISPNTVQNHMVKANRFITKRLLEVNQQNLLIFILTTTFFNFLF